MRGAMGGIECAMYAYAVIPRETFLCTSNKQWKSVRITKDHAETCARESNA